MSRRIASLMRRGGRSGLGSLVSAVVDAVEGYVFNTSQDGITQSSGEITSWDADGVTFEPFSVSVQPEAVTVGGPSASLVGARIDSVASERMLSTTSADLAMGVVFAFVGRIEDSTQNGREIIRIGSFVYVKQTAGGLIHAEHAAVDLITTTPIQDDEIFSLLVYWSPTGQTSFIELNGVQEDTAAGNDALNPPNAPIYIGSNAAGGVLWDGTWIEGIAYSDVDTLGALDFDGVRARLAYVKALAEGAPIRVHLMLGQSPLEGTEASTGFTAINGVDYTAKYPLVRLAKRPDSVWTPMDDSGGATGTGPEVSMARELVDLGENGGDRGIRVLAYGAGGVGYADFVTTDYATAKAYFDARLALLPRAYQIVSVSFVGGESDGNDAGEAAAVQSNLNSLKTSIETDYSAVLASGYTLAIKNLSVTYQTAVTDPATVNTGILAFAAEHSNVAVIDTNVAGVWAVDNLHPDPGGYVGFGRAYARAVVSGDDQTVIDGDDGT